jgi:hypothetical protein
MTDVVLLQHRVALPAQPAVSRQHVYAQNTCERTHPDRIAMRRTAQGRERIMRRAFARGKEVGRSQPMMFPEVRNIVDVGEGAGGDEYVPVAEERQRRRGRTKED